MTTTPIRLHFTAPWNPKLRNTYRQRFTQVDNRYFQVEAQWLHDPWTVNEIDRDGVYIDTVAVFVRNLAGVRQAIADAMTGMDLDQVQQRAWDAPPMGTGRNHPRHAMRRQATRI